MASAQEPPVQTIRIYLPFAWTNLPAKVEVESQIGGVSEALIVAGDLAYVGAGPRVLVFDHAAEPEPRLLGRSPVLPGVVRDLAIDELMPDRLVAALGGQGLAMLDISEPAAPRLRASLDLPDAGAASRIATIAGRVYTIDEHSSFGWAPWIVDWRNPEQPQILPFPSQVERRDIDRVSDLRILDRQLHALLQIRSDPAGPLEYHVFDLGDASAPRPVRSFQIGRTIWEETGHWAYHGRLATDGDRLHLVYYYFPSVRSESASMDLAEIDLADAGDPRLRWNLGAGGSRLCPDPSLSIRGSELYLACDDALLRFALRDDEQPRAAGRLEIASSDLATAGMQMLVTDPAGRLLRIDPSDPEQLVIDAEIDWPGRLRWIEADDRQVFAAGDPSGLHHFRLDAEALPRLHETRESTPIGLDLASELLILGEPGGIQLFDLRSQSGLELGIGATVALDGASSRQSHLDGDRLWVVDHIDTRPDWLRFHRLQLDRDGSGPVLLERETRFADPLGGERFRSMSAELHAGRLLVLGQVFDGYERLPGWVFEPLVSGSALVAVDLERSPDQPPQVPDWWETEALFETQTGPPAGFLTWEAQLLLADAEGLWLRPTETDPETAQMVRIHAGDFVALRDAGETQAAAASADGGIYWIDLESYPGPVVERIGQVPGRPVDLALGAGRVWVTTAEAGLFGLVDRSCGASLRPPARCRWIGGR